MSLDRKQVRPDSQSPGSSSGLSRAGTPASRNASPPGGSGAAASAPNSNLTGGGLSSIAVVVRKRPKLTVDREQDENDVVRCSGNETGGPDGAVTVYGTRTKLDLTPVIEPNSFVFDHVFGDDSTNEQVYRDCCQLLLASVRDGGGAVIFAFGQTGSGKTYTMLGDAASPGLYGLAVTELLGMTTATGGGLSASFYEVYGSKLYDLLNDRAEMRMLQDEYRNVHIVGLTVRDVCSVEDVNALMRSGQLLRAIGTTHANDQSSRSHAVLEIRVTPSSAAVAANSNQTNANGGGSGGEALGRITFVDLAGSERASDTAGTDAKTRREGAEINKSLLALKECIRAMSLRRRHIPFRGSKLTQILRESFTGRCRTCVIATISPCQSHCEDTLNTLRYADRIKELKGGAGAAAGLATPIPCRACGLPIFVGDRHVCRRQLSECPHCRKEMDRGELELHAAECREMPLRCPHCNERMLRGDLPRHNRRCFRAPVRCAACGQHIARNLMERHTLAECGGAKEKCRHCAALFPRQILASHERDCDAARIACPHCLKYVRQSRLDAHAAACFLNPNRAGPSTAAAANGIGNGNVGGHSGVTSSSAPERLPTVAGAGGPRSPGLSSRSQSDVTAPDPAARRRANRSLEAAGGNGSFMGRLVGGANRTPSPPPLRAVHGGEFNTTASLEGGNSVDTTRTNSVDTTTRSSTTPGGGGCPYARFGCSVRVTQLSLSAHLSDAVRDHLLLVTAYADGIDAQNAELRRLVVSDQAGDL